MPVAMTPRKDATLQLLQQVVGRQEAARIEAADAAAARRCSRTPTAIAGSTWRRQACAAVPRASRRLALSHRGRAGCGCAAAAPRRGTPPPSSTTPWNSGCQSGSRSNTNSRSPMVRNIKRAEDRADRAARAAEQRHAAEHDGGDRIERVGVAVGGRRLARVGDAGEEQPGDRGEQAATSR